MAFRSGYLRVQNASIITEKKHFLFKQRNQQPCTTRPEKKVELPQNKQIFSLVSGSLERIKKTFLYWSCLRTFMLTSALVPIYAAGFYTSTSGGHSNFRLLTKYLQKRRPEKPIPSLGKGKHSDLNLFPNYCSVLEVRISQKPVTDMPQREGEKAFSWCEHACVESASCWGMNREDERVYLWSPWRFPLRRSLQFSAGPCGGGFGTQLNFQANYLPDRKELCQPLANNILVL